MKNHIEYNKNNVEYSYDENFGFHAKFNLKMSPVSTNSKRRKEKLNFVTQVKKLTNKIKYIVIEDISITIIWYTTQEKRYESANFLDIDNIVKLIIDSISGKDGIIVDDCVVQHFSCSWIDNCGDEIIEIEIECASDSVRKKEDLCFLNLSNSLCCAWHKSFPKEMALRTIENYKELEKLKKETGDPYAGRHLKIIRRLFHRNKIQAFEIITY